jgi:acyl carrier protein
MTYEEARAHVLAAIDLNTPILNDPRIAHQLADAANDVAFADLDLDSLTSMEICLTIEDRTGLLIEPGDLVACTGINGLAALMAGRARSAA